MSVAEYNQWQQLAFCAALCERSFPNYELFCELEELDSKTARKILNKVWEYLRGQLKSLKNLEKQLEAMNDMIPDPEQYEQYGAYPAMDTLLNLQSCLQGILDSSISDAQAIQELTHARLEEVIELQGGERDKDGLWLRQLAFEKELDALLQAQMSHAEQVKQLIPLAQDGGVSQLGICLND